MDVMDSMDSLWHMYGKRRVRESAAERGLNEFNGWVVGRLDGEADGQP